MATRVFPHENYELLCSANAAGVGRFTAAVVVTKQSWPTRPRNVAMPRANYPTEESAIAAARAQGIEWIASYG